jgi:serine/threonine protein kinase
VRHYLAYAEDANMSVPDKLNGPNAQGSGTNDPKGNRETVLLSDVPDAASLMAEASAPDINLPSLSAVTLAALSQRYDILGEAGHGSMGNVYKARDRETGETVALKVLKPEIASDQAMMDRFKKELLYARKITHKNVCRLHEFNRIGGVAYTSMEFVEGESLRSVLNRFGGLPLRKANNVALQICSGLAEAHAQGIVHRDLKPENVMIDGQGNVKIMDFGIARSMEAGTRLTGSIVGTPAYMAPEQVAGKPVDYRTDIYSLGLMLYEMFTGTPAFQADTAVAVALKQMRETPPPPHEVDPTIPVSSERAILKCLEKEPGKRFQSVVDLEKLLRSPGAVVGADAAEAPSSSASRENPTRARDAASALSFRSLQAEPEAKRGSAGKWAAVIVLGALAVFGGLRAKSMMESVDNLPPPARIAAPKPPVFVTERSPASPATNSTEQPAAPAAAVEPKHAEAKPVPVRPSAPATENSSTILPAPAPARSRAREQERAAASAALLRREGTQGNKAGQQTTRPGVSMDTQPRAGRAIEETNSAAGDNRNASTYLWVGRYAIEERAQKAAKKIEELGLPVTVIPRHNASGDFFLVVTGPFGGQRVASVTQWLETQGFSNVHPFTLPGTNQKSVP